MITSVTIKGPGINEEYKVKHPGDDSKTVTAIIVPSSGGYACITFDDKTMLEFTGKHLVFRYYSKNK